MCLIFFVLIKTRRPHLDQSSPLPSGCNLLTYVCATEGANERSIGGRLHILARRTHQKLVRGRIVNKTNELRIFLFYFFIFQQWLLNSFIKSEVA